MQEKGIGGIYAHPFPANHKWDREKFHASLIKKWSLTPFSPSWEIAWAVFQLTSEEHGIVKLQKGKVSTTYGGRRYLPMAFTETGVAMLSSVLTSERAAQVNIAIMRTFVKLRSFLAIENSLPEKVNRLESGTNKLFKIVFERLDTLEEQVLPKVNPSRKRIGLKE